MKILKVTGGFPPAEKEGGTAVVGHALAKYLTRLGHEVKAFTTNINGPGWLEYGNEWREYDEVSVYYAQASKKWTRYYSPSLIKELEKHICDADIVLMAAVWVWYGPQVARLCRKYNVPYVLYPHGVRSRERMLMQSFYKKTAWWYMFDKKMFLNADGLVAITESERQEMLSIGIKCPIKVIPNGVESIPLVQDPRQLLFNLYGIPIESPIVFFIGRIETIKGVDLAISSFELVLKKCPSATLVLAGPDRENLTEKLVSMATELGISDRVIFTGSVKGDTRSALYHSASLLLLPSITEVLAMSVLEALKCGVPVVVTDKEAFVDVIDGGAGLGCERNKEDIATAILSLLLDEKTIEMMQAKAKQLAEEMYSWRVVSERTVAFCESLLAGQKK